MKYIVIKAGTNSEWDSVDTILIPATTYFLQRLKMMEEVTNNCKQAAALMQEVTFISDVQAQFIIGADLIDFLLPGDSNINVVDLEPLGGIEHLLENKIIFEPENKLSTVYIEAQVKSFRFKAYGEHTEEIFWGELIEYNQVKLK